MHFICIRYYARLAPEQFCSSNFTPFQPSIAASVVFRNHAGYKQSHAWPSTCNAPCREWLGRRLGDKFNAIWTARLNQMSKWNHFIFRIGNVSKTFIVSSVYPSLLLRTYMYIVEQWNYHFFSVFLLSFTMLYHAPVLHIMWFSEACRLKWARYMEDICEAYGHALPSTTIYTCNLYISNI